MPTVTYEYQPNESVYVVLDATRIEAGTVLKVDITSAEPAVSATVVEYTVLLDDEDEGVVSVLDSTIFGDLTAAVDYAESLV